MGKADYYLVCKKSSLKGIRSQVDREYLSNPVAVELLYSCRETRLVYVRDIVRDCVFPCIPSKIVSRWRLPDAKLAKASDAMQLA